MKGVMQDSGKIRFMFQCFTKIPLASAWSMDRVAKPEAEILVRRLCSSSDERRWWLSWRNMVGKGKEICSVTINW